MTTTREPHPDDYGFKPNDAVRITAGPFKGFEGTVDDVFPAKGQVRIVIFIYGRASPVDVEVGEIERI